MSIEAQLKATLGELLFNCNVLTAQLADEQAAHAKTKAELEALKPEEVEAEQAPFPGPPV